MTASNETQKVAVNLNLERCSMPSRLALALAYSSHRQHSLDSHGNFLSVDLSSECELIFCDNVPNCQSAKKHYAAPDVSPESSSVWHGRQLSVKCTKPHHLPELELYFKM